MRWKDIWVSRKPLNCECDNELNSNRNDQILLNLIRTDGFDSGTGSIQLDSWKSYVDWVDMILQVSKNNSIYEVGCGSGALLYPFYIKGYKVGGLDYSSLLISNAEKIMKDMDFMVNEALNLTSEIKYDFVVANSVFFYFPDYAYAERVLDKMVEKAIKRVLIMDVPDLKLKDECEKVRSSAYPPGEYEKKYKGLSHLYFDREWFVNYCLKNQLTVKLYDQKISNYDNSRFRFNCLIEL